MRTVGGAIEVLDEDEFAAHQRTLRYPQHLVDSARSAVDEAVDLLTQRIEPFDTAARRWIETAQTSR
ncbi:MAG TPA: hypothetical protein VLG28_15975 [Acidimicrobiia bacterium]|nr:hypothetical protein [Acidimicrobiia bacterium]